MDQHLVGTGRVEADHRGQRIHVDLHHVDGVGRLGGRPGQNHGHRLAHVPDSFGGQPGPHHGLVKRRNGRRDRRQVEVIGSQDGHHARGGQGLGGVDAEEGPVGDHRPDERSVQGVVGHQVGHVPAVADQQWSVLDPADRCPEKPHRSDLPTG